MVRKKKTGKTGINEELETAISELLVRVMNDPEASLTDRCKVLDRALKLEALKLKGDDADWGAGLFADGDEEE